MSQVDGGRRRSTVLPMMVTTVLQVQTSSEWLEGQPVGEFSTPTPRVPPRPALKPLLDSAPEPKAPPKTPLSQSDGALHCLRKTFRSARELLRDQERARSASELPALPTALPEIDRLLGGGLDRGRLVELVGARSSGRFSLVLAALAAATSIGEAAALVDLGDGFDPAGAELAGVDLERLLWSRPRRIKDAFAATEMLLESGFPLVVLDLGTPPVPGGRGQDAFWLRLARAAQVHRGALLVSAPYRVSGPAAAKVIGTESPRVSWLGARLLLGLESRVRVEKVRGASAPPAGVALELAVAGELPFRRRRAPRVVAPPLEQPLPRVASATARTAVAV
jgi:hypothetical protein